VTRGPILLGGGAVCLAAAVLLALLARDVGRWPGAIRSGDVAAASPAQVRQTSWTAGETLPLDPARHLLGLGDDLAFRRAVARFRNAYPRDADFQRSAAGGQARVRAETALAKEIATDRNRSRASTASNLLGILALVDVASAQQSNPSADRSIFAFQSAVRLDPANEQAKRNLELLYQQNAYSSSVRGRERLQRSEHAGASASETGSGY
jgi:hypothetical protein